MKETQSQERRLPEEEKNAETEMLKKKKKKKPTGGNTSPSSRYTSAILSTMRSTEACRTVAREYER